MTTLPLQYEHREPVPQLSQLAALPFVSAVAGYLGSTVNCGYVRVTLHRVMSRDQLVYLQQVCSYAGAEMDNAKAGRLFIVDDGIIGAAFRHAAIVRSRYYEDNAGWWADYRADRLAVGDERAEPSEPISYLAVPFLDADGGVMCVLYAEAGGLNRFVGESSQLDALLGMSIGFCGMLDHLSEHPLPRLRNYPLPAGTPVGGRPTLFVRLQETVQDREPPRLECLTSFNFAPGV